MSPEKLDHYTMPIIKSGLASKFYSEITSKEFLNHLSELTGIPNLIEDPNLNGAGYHQTTNGGFLDVHVDFNRLENNQNYDRRLNLIVYLNKKWNKDNGGFLELWDMEKNKQLENISPSFNRCVIFETNEISFHGHPKPVKVSNNESRKSLSVYYYTRGRNDIPLTASHNTIYRNTESVTGFIKIFINGVKHFFRKIKK